RRQGHERRLGARSGRQGRLLDRWLVRDLQDRKQRPMQRQEWNDSPEGFDDDLLGEQRQRHRVELRIGRERVELDRGPATVARPPAPPASPPRCARSTGALGFVAPAATPSAPATPAPGTPASPAPPPPAARPAVARPGSGCTPTRPSSSDPSRRT